VTKRVSLRSKLILASGSLAFVTALILGTVLHLRTERQMLQQVDKTLETRCDEVITVLESPTRHPALKDFLVIETASRSNPNTYLYQLRDARGRILLRSENLDAELPMPDEWRAGDLAPALHFRTTQNPHDDRKADRVRLRSERLEIRPPGAAPGTFVIQTAASLAPFDAAVRSNLYGAIVFAACALGAVFFLLWFVTTRALRPVAAMTKKASEISASNLRERLPLAGRADELDELASVLNDMLDRLGGALRQMEQFSSDAAHQLRTPLTRIRGELELLLREPLADPAKNQLENIQEEVLRLSRVCARLLLLARLDQPGQGATLLTDQIDVEELLSELLEQMAPLAQDRGIELRRGATAAARVRGSRPLLVEALLNILDNALRYTPAGGFVEVSIDANDRLVRLAVQDNGPGIPIEERERVFQPFYRISRPGPAIADEGSGLGLAIVRAIAQAHGGRVEAIDAPMRGIVFRLTFPVERVTE
jgi:two-component system, OmpR family, sensor kinase